MHTTPRDENLEAARQRVVAAFQHHWGKLLRSRRDIAKEREDYFLAGSSTARARLSRRFYSREHARQMGCLTPTEARESLSPWLEHAVRYWLDECSHIGYPDGDDFLAELPTAEYVSIVTAHESFAGRTLIDRYPGERFPYDDLYERMLSGYSRGGVLRIYKSTGEGFTSSEARSALAGIVRELHMGIADAGDEDPWVFSTQLQSSWQTVGFAGEDCSRVVICEVNDYGDNVLGQEVKRRSKVHVK